MAKFSVYYKDKLIQASVFSSGIIHIGRDESNDLVIDSLAVAPAHAVAVIKDGICILKQMNEKYPLLINHMPMKECCLDNEDVINIGKHNIVYTKPYFLTTANNVSKNRSFQGFAEEMIDSDRLPDAHLQYLDGEYIGRILPLKNALTSLGHQDEGVVIIARRKLGYYISALEEHPDIAVNDHPLGDRIIKLHNNDVLLVDNTPLQFFLD
ncbi:FHA domain-containing protein [Methylomonas sp. AM2-LC]|uniref:FHA domain-containing protein n=1 Tax=Methylomonas sp. AM2-LC TaxID=3153301 RepID=UPI003265C69D